MFVLVRAVVYATLFIGFLLVYLPARFLAWSGIVRPEVIGGRQIAGMISWQSAERSRFGVFSLSCLSVKARLRSRRFGIHQDNR
jgi:hypothetical protein